MSNNLDTTEPIEVDTEYTWLQEPQTMTHSDEVAQLRAELEQMKKELDLARRQLYFFRGAFPKAARNWDKAVIK